MARYLTDWRGIYRGRAQAVVAVLMGALAFSKRSVTSMADDLPTAAAQPVPSS